MQHVLSNQLQHANFENKQIFRGHYGVHCPACIKSNTLQKKLCNFSCLKSMKPQDIVFLITSISIHSFLHISKNVCASEFAVGHYSCWPSLKNFMQQEIFFAITYKYFNTCIHFYSFSSYLNISPIGHIHF